MASRVIRNGAICRRHARPSWRFRFIGGVADTPGAITDAAPHAMPARDGTALAQCVDHCLFPWRTPRWY